MSKVIIANNKCCCEFEVWIKVTYDQIRILGREPKALFEFKKECKVLNMCMSHEKEARTGLLKNIKKNENKEFYEAAQEYLLNTNNIIT